MLCLQCIIVFLWKLRKLHLMMKASKTASKWTLILVCLWMLIFKTSDWDGLHCTAWWNKGEGPRVVDFFNPCGEKASRYEGRRIERNGESVLDLFSRILLLLIPAVYTGEEDSLSLICRSHLPGVVNHPFFIATRAASVNHRSLQVRVLLFLQRYCWLLHRVEDNCWADHLAWELCYRDAEGAAGAADCVLYYWKRKHISTFWAEVGITTETRHHQSVSSERIKRLCH